MILSGAYPNKEKNYVSLWGGTGLRGSGALLLLEGSDDLTDLATQTNGVALRNEDHAVEGVCDDEDGEVTSTELHIRDELGEDRTLVIKTEDCTLGKTCKVLWTVAALARLILEEEDEATAPVLEDFTLCDDVLQRMVRRLFASPEDAEDIVATACRREDGLFLTSGGCELLGLRQVLSFTIVGVEILCIEATEDCYSRGVATHKELLIGRLPCLDIEGAHIHQDATARQT